MDLNCFIHDHDWDLNKCKDIECKRCHQMAAPYIQANRWPVTWPQVAMRMGALRNRVTWGASAWYHNRVITCFDCGRLEKFFGRHIGDHGKCLRY